ncbi:MAG: hypothetical protein OXC61_01870 [Flavobacteriaceae bacterium]|nr:hypothetical protein [Flavobacteriaceae bacterium]
MKEKNDVSEKSSRWVLSLEEDFKIIKARKAEAKQRYVYSKIIIFLSYALCLFGF